MVFDKNRNLIKVGDKVKNTDTQKIFVFTKEMETVLNHSELFPQNQNKVWQYNHLVKISHQG